MNSWLAFGLILGLLFVGSVALNYELYVHNYNYKLQTWEQYDITIQYPNWANPQVQGVQNHQVTYDDGLVKWTWNEGSTTLSLLWVTNNWSAFNNTEALIIINEGLQGKITNMTFIDQGDFKILHSGCGGLSCISRSDDWSYQTYSAIVQGKTTYLTYATYSFYTNSYADNHRFFILAFEDSKSHTLNSVEYFANTFSGV